MELPPPLLRVEGGLTLVLARRCHFEVGRGLDAATLTQLVRLPYRPERAWLLCNPLNNLVFPFANAGSWRRHTRLCSFRQSRLNSLCEFILPFQGHKSVLAGHLQVAVTGDFRSFDSAATDLLPKVMLARRKECKLRPWHGCKWIPADA